MSADRPERKRRDKASEARDMKLLVAIRLGETPVHIPNTMVKPLSGRRYYAGDGMEKIGGCQILIKKAFSGFLIKKITRKRKLSGVYI